MNVKFEARQYSFELTLENCCDDTSISRVFYIIDTVGCCTMTRGHIGKVHAVSQMPVKVEFLLKLIFCWTDPVRRPCKPQ